MVQPNWSMIASMETAGIPMSLVAGANFEALMISILADLERRFSVDRNRTYLAGYSRAGNSTLYFGLHWPDRWAGIVVAAGYYNPPEPVFDNLANLAVLAAYGKDKQHRAANEFTARLKGPKVATLACQPRAIDDPFEQRAWRWMAQQKRDPHPKTVRYTLHNPQHSGAYWIPDHAHQGDRRDL